MKCSKRRHNVNRKTKQHKTTRPRQSGGIRTHDCPLARHTLLPTELLRQLSWLGSNHIYNTKQPKHLNQSITNQINRLTQTYIYEYGGSSMKNLAAKFIPYIYVYGHLSVLSAFIHTFLCHVTSSFSQSQVQEY